MTRYQALTATTALSTLALIAVGAVVRTTGSGLGCPDWPLCHGQLIPPAERTAIIEYSHRSLAAIVGLLIVSVAVTTWRLRREDRTLVALVAASLPLLALQAWFGKITVERELPAEIVAIHLATAMVLLSILVLIAALAFLGSGRSRLTSPERTALVRLGAGTSAIVFLVIVGGAYVVGSNSTVACNSWPGCSSAPIPFIDGVRETHIHWLHRLAVLVGLAAVALLAVRLEFGADVGQRLRQAGWGLVALYVFQIVLGAMNIWTDFSEEARVAHLAGGSAVWGLAVLVTVSGAYRPGELTEVAHRPERRPSGSTGVARV